MEDGRIGGRIRSPQSRSSILRISDAVGRYEVNRIHLVVERSARGGPASAGGRCGREIVRSIFLHAAASLCRCLKEGKTGGDAAVKLQILTPLLTWRANCVGKSASNCWNYMCCRCSKDQSIDRFISNTIPRSTAATVWSTLQSARTAELSRI